MDDLSGQVDGTIRKLLSSLVGVFYGPFDPITEAEFLGEADRHFASSEGVLLSLEQVDQVARIVGIQFGLYLGFQPETFPKVGCRPSTVWGTGLHIPMGGGRGRFLARRLHGRIRHNLNLAVINR